MPIFRDSGLRKIKSSAVSCLPRLSTLDTVVEVTGFSDIRGVKTQYQLKNITFQTDVLSASWLATETVWKVQIKNNLTGEEDTKTCNVLASAVGLLQHPLYPELVDKSAFQGPIFHTARYDHTIDLTAKAVVVIGNGCSAVQLIPVSLVCSYFAPVLILW